MMAKPSITTNGNAQFQSPRIPSQMGPSTAAIQLKVQVNPAWAPILVNWLL